jgi:thiol-disulfide isomerase/thioredoxin
MKKYLIPLIVLGVGGIALSTLNHSMSQAPSVVQPVQAQSPAAQGKPTIVKIHADWCPACKTLNPIFDSLQQQYQGRANFVVLDVTDRARTQASEAKARELGLSSFFAAKKSQTATIAVINPKNGQVLQEFQKNFDTQTYVNAIDTAITQVSQR